MTAKLTSSDLLGLEQYARDRADIRHRIIAHKKMRTIQVGPNTTWCFEDRETIKYQVHEMLRAERVFEPAGIQDELDAYNPLIPDGSNWKVTFLIEFADEAERRTALTKLKGVEDRCWVQVGTAERVYAIADEDLERENDEKTSAVHFLRFELTTAMSQAAKSGAAIAIGVAHRAYEQSLTLTPASRDTLTSDLA
ncbi:MAG TPA: DUF3501 family protein [Steroidobacteraceae bacterium]|nr:DUF3501 family protein [Steroidobacteraceae bacterium]